MWLANDIPEASTIGYELYSWPMAFQRQVELDMSYVAG